MDFRAVYQFAPRAAARRETFGGIVYHYEGTRPDPRMVFVPSPFLMGLLERMEQAPLRDLIDAAAARFAMPGSQVSAVEAFFAELGRLGAIEKFSC